MPPRLYGAEATEATQWSGDYRRSILEIALIDAAFNKGIPLMAVCRGFQMVNVLFGAQLNQHVPWQLGAQRFQFNTPAKHLLGSKLPNSFRSAVSHHQAVKQEPFATDHIEPTIIYNGMVKGAELKYPVAAPMVLTQFHPEYLNTQSTEKTYAGKLKANALNLVISTSNDEFFKLFGTASLTHFRRNKVNIELLTPLR
ncbi:gamma-glutamyl-gamma-aminobutyrate hydrolase family protein [Chitinimonas arctica]|uniref:gamma-glutamyl-gamma-aminobutyrate hydrolase family protein n=1 Tax=Chitinimonas arctica TaxID=2594795 RepID=UPI0021E007B2|nr:gamma-glutamyl-gamma-aminobutyrate hydrolase family protein [Chitinimonas arctica]